MGEVVGSTFTLPTSDATVSGERAIEIMDDLLWHETFSYSGETTYPELESQPLDSDCQYHILAKDQRSVIVLTGANRETQLEALFERDPTQFASLFSRYGYDIDWDSFTSPEQVALLREYHLVASPEDEDEKEVVDVEDADDEFFTRFVGHLSYETISWMLDEAFNSDGESDQFIEHLPFEVTLRTFTITASGGAGAEGGEARGSVSKFPGFVPADAESHESEGSVLTKSGDNIVVPYNGNDFKVAIRDFASRVGGIGFIRCVVV